MAEGVFKNIHANNSTIAPTDTEVSATATRYPAIIL